MPQPRKYETHAQRQAAYLQRTRRAQDALLLSCGLPTGPAIPSMPGTVRWAAAIAQSKDLLDTICQEMQDYFDDRSEEWRESEKAEAFVARMEATRELIDGFDAIEQ